MGDLDVSSGPVVLWAGCDGAGHRLLHFRLVALLGHNWINRLLNPDDWTWDFGYEHEPQRSW